MKFEEIKKVWDEKNQRSIYTVDEGSIYRDVIKKNHRITRSVGIFEWSMIFMMLSIAVIMTFEGVVDREYYQIPEGAIYLVVAVYLYRDHRKRIGLKVQAGNSVMELLEKSIAILDYQAARQRTFIWWFLMPITLTVIIHFIFTYEGKPWWLWPLTAFSLIYANWMIRKETREKWLPQKRELESLKKLMTDG